jgi:hypothetical protein
MNRLKHQWITPLLVLPFVAMYALHRYLDLSDAMMVAPAPGERDWFLYNWVMVCTFQASVSLYLVHTTWLAPRNWILAAIKIVALAVAWTAFIVAAPF